MSKGKRRERQAAELYEGAGYETFRPQESKFGETDMFGLFDILAINADGNVVLSQVKANQTRGLAEFDANAQLFIQHPNIDVHYLVCVDRQGWRLSEFEPSGYHWAVDERDMDCSMGEGVIEYLGADA